MFQFIKNIVILSILVTLISACEIETYAERKVSDPNEEKQSAVENAPHSTNTQLTLINQFSGSELYNNLCETCHGKIGPVYANKFNTTELKLLVILINQSMPITNPESCVDECASKVANYVFNQMKSVNGTPSPEYTKITETSTDSSELKNIIPQKETENIEVQVVIEKNGAEIFNTMCISCHGAVGQTNNTTLTINYNFDLASLETLIDQSMPITNPESCVDECASKVANYVFNQMKPINSTPSPEYTNITETSTDSSEPKNIIPQKETENFEVQVAVEKNGAEIYNTMCISCHGAVGQINNTTFTINNNFDLTSLETLIDQSMPPSSPGTCTKTCAQKVATYIYTSFASSSSTSTADSTSKTVNVVNNRNAGNVTLHRLNHTEYNNTVRDLLMTKEKPASNFPADDFGYGFNNIANVLSLSPLHVELLEDSASVLSKQAAIKESIENISIRTEAETLLGTSGEAYTNEWMLFSNGSILTIYQIQEPGDYVFTAKVWATQGGTELVSMDILFDGIVVENKSVPNTETDPGIFQITKTLQPGPIEFGVAFINDYSNVTTGEDRNLLVDWLQIEGPINKTPTINPYRAILMSCDPNLIGITPCATQIITDFSKQAWRRPVTVEEVNELVSIFNLAIQQGDEFDVGIALAMKAVLLSPNFIFRVELDTATIAGTYPLTPHELASRLSYFLWSSKPDSELIALADSGELLLQSTIAQQVERMLTDPKSVALVNNFSGQWLHTQGLSEHTPNVTLFPNWNESLKISFQTETQKFFTHLIQTNQNMNKLLTANYSFINTELAAYYGIMPPSAEFEKTVLPINRQGFLTQGSFLAVTSLPTRTSVVKRGKWILSNLLCSEPPPPPPAIPSIPSSDIPSVSLREIMELHRQNPVCASCHSMMDPIGFSLEHFNAIGQWRDLDNGFIIDDSGQLPDGTSFQGAKGLAQVIVNDPRYSVCIVEKLFTYALGRGPLSTDEVYLDEINSTWTMQGMQFNNLVKLIAQSEPFTSRYTDGVP